MRVPGILALAVTLAGCAAAQPTATWTELDQRGLWETIKLAERNATAFSSHRDLFRRTLEEYRERFAPSLRLTPESTAVTVTCGSTTSEHSLPATSEDSVAALVALSPLLSQCLDSERLERFTYPQALAQSVLVALDLHSRLVVPESHVPVSPVPTPSATPEVVGKNGYLPIPGFYAGTGESVASTLRTFHEQDVHGLVVDLRGNSGGLVTEISEVLGHFAAPGTHLFSVRARAARNSGEHASTGPDLIPNARVAVLVDRSTSSGGELAALALRQLRGALLVGEPTEGYSSIQTVYPLSNGWGVAITTAAWIAPGDARIPETGVLPNIAVEPMQASQPESRVDDVLARAFATLSQ